MKEVLLTEAEFQMLEPYEIQLRCAVESNYYRGVGRIAANMMYDLWETKIGRPKNNRDDSCGSCLLDLLKDVGQWYFAAKSARDAKAVEIAQGEKIKVIGSAKRKPLKKRTQKKIEE